MIDLKETLRPDIVSYVSGVPIYVLDKAVIDGCRIFLNESLLWEEEQNIDAYTDSVLILPSDYERTHICDVISVKNELGLNIPFTWYASKIHFEEAPMQTVCVKVALMNNRANKYADVPDWVYNQHSEAIVHASTQLIKSQQSKPWFSGESAAFHFNEYKRYLAESRIEKVKDNVQMNPFA